MKKYNLSYEQFSGNITYLHNIRLDGSGSSYWDKFPSEFKCVKFLINKVMFDFVMRNAAKIERYRIKEQ